MDIVLIPGLRLDGSSWDEVVLVGHSAGGVIAHAAVDARPEEGFAPVREFTKIRDVEHADLPTGHWPQFTRPEQLGRAIVARVGA